MRRTILTAMFLTLAQGAALASFEDEATSLSYIAYLERYATIQPATQEQELEAAINMPLVAGDRIDTAREARVELILSDASVVWLDEYTTLSLDAVAYSRDTMSQRTVLFLAEGQMVIELPQSMQAIEPTRIDGAGETVYLEGPGLYRIENLRSGGLRVEAWRGFAEAATAAGNVRIRTEYAVEMGGGMVSEAIPDLTTTDDFARWVQARRSIAPGQSSQYVDARYAREASQLDTYGSWVYLDSYSTWAWRPTVAAAWNPYRAGRWYWTVTGWNWLSYEPWGWLPYHYGNWIFAANVGWVWSWHSVWSPAWVYWSSWPGYVGWCPYGWYGGWWYNTYPQYTRHPHGGHGRPPRGDVVPPPGGGGGAVPRDARPVSASRLAVRMDGTTEVSALDSRGWTTVRERDFASPHVSRLVRPASELTQSRATARVSSSPLVTDMPRRGQSVAPSVQRAITGPQDRAVPDITDVVARRSELPPERATQLARPSTVGEVATSSRSVTAPQVRANAPTESRDAAAIGRSLGYEATARAVETDRSAVTNRYRSRYGLSASDAFGGGHRTPTQGGPPTTSSSDTVTRSPVTTGRSSIGRSSAGGVSSTRPPVSTRPSTGTSSSSAGTTRVTPRVPVTRSSGTTSTGSTTQRPVIVPRSPTTRSSSGSTPSRSGLVPRSAYVPRSSSGSARTPSRSSAPQVSAPSRSSGSRSTPRVSSGSRSSGSSSRGSVSRSSGSRSTTSSSSSSSSSSSGGSARRR